MYLLDTNVVSELRKRERCDENVTAWYARVSDDELFLSVLTLGEIRKGIELIRDRDPNQAVSLENWLRYVEQHYEDRTLSIDAAISDAWGRMYYIRNVSAVDGLLAATAQIHNLTVATRNVVHFQGLGVKLLNPFSPRTGGSHAQRTS